MPQTPDPDTLLTIGEVARESGLTASALRFYDREGVLVPAAVDGLNGYRRYAVPQVRAARLLASLRRVGMPLAEAALVLDEDARGAAGAAADVVRAHEQRLVDGLRDARREIARTLALLDEPRGDAVEAQPSDRVVVAAADLAAAVTAVRFAVAPATPVAGTRDGLDLSVLTGVLLELGSDGVRLVATDRYRLAVSLAVGLGPSASTAQPGSGISVGQADSAVVPVQWVDEVVAACRADEGAQVVVEIAPGRAVATVGGETVATPLVPGAFPDYRSFIDPGLLSFADGEVSGHAGTVDVAALQPLLPVEAQTVGLVVREGTVHLAGVPGATGAEVSVADVHVDPEFLHEALAVAGPWATLVLDGPHRPLAIRGSGVGFSVLMPVAVP
ncbi:MerR family DNA-binding transcriptional regulator [Terrabacter koreensis]